MNLTRRLRGAAQDLQDLRNRVHTLAEFLLRDEHGISERSFEQLAMLMDEIGGCVDLGPVDAVDGRFFFPVEV